MIIKINIIAALNKIFSGVVKFSIDINARIFPINGVNPLTNILFNKKSIFSEKENQAVYITYSRTTYLWYLTSLFFVNFLSYYGSLFSEIKNIQRDIPCLFKVKSIVRLSKFIRTLFQIKDVEYFFYLNITPASIFRQIPEKPFCYRLRPIAVVYYKKLINQNFKL